MKLLLKNGCKNSTYRSLWPESKSLILSVISGANADSLSNLSLCTYWHEKQHRKHERVSAYSSAGTASVFFLRRLTSVVVSTDFSTVSVKLLCWCLPFAFLLRSLIPKSGIYWNALLWYSVADLQEFKEARRLRRVMSGRDDDRRLFEHFVIAGLAQVRLPVHDFLICFYAFQTGDTIMTFH